MAILVFSRSFWEVWLFTFLLLWPKNLAIKEIAMVFGNRWKVANYTGCQTKLIVQHLAHFAPFLKALADKLMTHSKISFKSLVYNVASEFPFFLFNICYVGLKKLLFRLLELLLNLQQNWMSDNQSIFDHFKRSQMKSWCHHLKSFLKVGKILWTLNYIKFIKKMLWQLLKK